MTKQIPLTQGKFAIVDDEDYERVSKFKWRAHRGHTTWYGARTRGVIFGRTNILLHRFIMDTPPGKQVDHIDGDGLNCTRKNMRECLPKENARNLRTPKNSTTGYKGVSKRIRGWRAQIVVNDKQIYLGTFDSPESAAKAYNEAAKKYHGDFARLNDLSGRE